MLKDNKLLIKINKQYMLEKIVDTSLNSSADNTVVVLGYQSNLIQEIIQNKEIITIINRVSKFILVLYKFSVLYKYSI